MLFIPTLVYMFANFTGDVLELVDVHAVTATENEKNNLQLKKNRYYCSEDSHSLNNRQKNQIDG